MEEPSANLDWRKSSYSHNGGSDCVEVCIWRKSSYSNGGTANCVEVGVWRKSSFSNGGMDNCVEVGRAPSVVLVRDTKHSGAGPTLHVTPAAWRALLAAIRG